MQKSISINSFDELVKFMKRDEVSIEQVAEIIHKAFKMIVLIENFKNKDVVIDKFCQIYKDAKHQKELPIFLALDISVIH
jgi:hypothetical protein